MRTRRILILTATVIAIGTIGPVAAQSTWTGTAVVGRQGEFPPGGLYAASNTFSLNSMVDVTNDTTGETVRVIVVRRLDDPGVFMLLSEEAANELRISRSSRASVSARPVRMPGLTAIGPNQDLPFHPDPDINPAATLGDPNANVIRPPELAEEPEPELEPEPEPAPEPAQVTGTPETRPQREPDLLVLTPDPSLPTVEEPPTLEYPIPGATPPTTAPLVLRMPLPSDPNGVEPRLVRPAEADPVVDPLRERLAEIERTLAAERVSAIPLERAYSNGLISRPPAVVTAESELELPELPEISPPEDADVADVPPQPPESEPLNLELPLAADPFDTPEVAHEPVRPEHIPDDAVLALEPAEFRSPEVRDPKSEPEETIPPIVEKELEPEAEIEPEPDPAVAVRETPSPVDLPVVSALERGAYYVQVAAMSSSENAARAVQLLNGEGTGYPVAITTQRNGDRDIYRVFVGPLTADERGTALYTVRNRGFHDAFLRAE